ncbi:hypothetical protein F2Q69_00053179 [Brassica cretica]|uniref:Uncharacterized protein n=2 Tax=Brassica cretica TaxID=69181 RepID=A0ABQ7E1A4_BRACR|nr:hypothetical protein F2Q69_00053179 [Brassica cretica]KAF3590265.1 hypothetical protein DY000_02022194 [Brassica cretica]
MKKGRGFRGERAKKLDSGEGGEVKQMTITGGYGLSPLSLWWLWRLVVARVLDIISYV